LDVVLAGNDGKSSNHAVGPTVGAISSLNDHGLKNPDDQVAKKKRSERSALA
jgi:hypothetical protein